MDILSLTNDVVKDVSPGRLIETILALIVIWTRVKPFLKSYDERLKNLEQAVKDGFKQGELRFQKILIKAFSTVNSNLSTGVGVNYITIKRVGN